VNLDATVVFDEAHLAKAIHEETDARAGSPDHIRESFLRNRRNQRLLFARLAELGHQQEDSRKTPLAGVEELIDKIGLDAHTAGQQVSHEHLRKSMLLMHDADHLIAFDLERNTVNNGRCGRQTQTFHRRDRFFSDEVAWGQERDGGFFTGARDNSESCAAMLKIEDGVGRISLGEEELLGL
jgi:hypothetical protein